MKAYEGSRVAPPRFAPVRMPPPATAASVGPVYRTQVGEHGPTGPLDEPVGDLREHEGIGHCVACRALTLHGAHLRGLRCWGRR